MNENKIDSNILANLSINNVLSMATQNDSFTIWSNLKIDANLIDFCQSIVNMDLEEGKKLLCSYHDTLDITVLQWLLWYVGSGVRAYAQNSHGPYSRKDWAYHKISLIKKHTTPELWKALVHTPTGFESKCSTIHFFSRHAYTVDKNQLDDINKWLDDCNGRFRYSHSLDEYGFEPGEYVNFHRKRQALFRKKAKKNVDGLVKVYHSLENNVKKRWEFGKQFLKTNKENYWEWLKEVSNNGNQMTYKVPEEMRKELYSSAVARIQSHLIHKNLFKDALTKVEQEEEKKGRGFSQMHNHLWIIKTYSLILRGTTEGKNLANFAKANGVDI